jgi:magnesium-transporting ATPase (P-type)
MIATINTATTTSAICNNYCHSPLTKEIKAFVVFTGGGAVLLAILLFAIGMGVGLQFQNALALAIGIFVAAALCGMPATVSSYCALTITSIRTHTHAHVHTYIHICVHAC